MSELSTQPCCERCWIDNNSMTADGDLRVKLPVMSGPMQEVGIKVCCFCGQTTIMGIFIKVPSDEVLFPQEDLTPSKE